MKIPCCLSHKSSEGKLMRPVSGNFHYPYTVLEKEKYKKSMGGKCEEQRKVTMDGTEHTGRITENIILPRKMKSTPPKFQKSPEKDRKNTH